MRLGDVGLYGLEEDGVRGGVGQVQLHLADGLGQRAGQGGVDTHNHVHQLVGRRKGLVVGACVGGCNGRGEVGGGESECVCLHACM